MSLANYTIPIAPVIYISLLLLELFFLVSITIYLAFLIYSSLMGAPYVPTSRKQTKDLLALIKYTADEDKLEKVMENPSVIKTPVVRNGKASTLGYQPDVWKSWS